MVKATEKYGDKINTLVKVTDGELNKFMAENYKNLSSFGGKRSKINNSAYNQGMEAGKNANMTRGVATGTSIAVKSIA
jgi:hypothetical protein